MQTPTSTRHRIARIVFGTPIRVPAVHSIPAHTHYGKTDLFFSYADGERRIASADITPEKGSEIHLYPRPAASIDEMVAIGNAMQDFAVVIRKMNAEALSVPA